MADSVCEHRSSVNKLWKNPWRRI